MERYTWVRFAVELTSCHKTHIAKVSIPVGRWNVTRVGSACKHSPAATPKSRARAQQPVSSRVSSMGRWMKVQGKGRRQAHVRSRVVMDIAAFKISHSVGKDKDTTALRAKSGARNVPSGRWRKYLGKGRKCAYPRSLIRVHVGVGQCCRAVDVESRALQAKNRKRDIPSGRWRTCQGRFKMQTLTVCDAKNQARAQQSVSSRASPMGRCLRWRKYLGTGRK